ncbi:Pre-mRNA-splicing factor [Rhizophlyctis rosea]|uniref:Pre-mRNA-splicing factor n=1 Tax=Rhizophlyctis rosea TaxID=64517 RepID=A0AAD5WZ14_9FUNG|nr:Pre-mRNA-splicing factor [Rhizophlyctis rosea]
MSVNLNKPARRQVKRNPNERPTIDMDQTGSYNIWYHRFQGDRRKRQPLEKAQTRCNIAKDSGRTRARDPGGTFCVHFARGACDKGSDCAFLHRLPTGSDKIGNSTDCFGRERHRDERDDMGGVGSFEKDNRTLYVGNISQSRDMDETVRKHFEEWGEIERLNCLTHKGVAFVRYALRCHAEFAKEAMYGQSLDNDEVLNVRWAVEDPNPRAQAAKAEATDALVTAAVLSKLPQIGSEGTILDYDAYKYGYVEQSDTDTHQQTQPADQSYAYAYDPQYYIQQGYDPAWAAYYASYGYALHGAAQQGQEQGQHEGYEGYDGSYSYAYPAAGTEGGEQQGAGGGEEATGSAMGGDGEGEAEESSGTGATKRPAEEDADGEEGQALKKAKSDALTSLVATYESDEERGDEDEDKE